MLGQDPRSGGSRFPLMAPLCQPVKKNLPDPARLTTLHAESGMPDVRESFRAEIALQIKRIGLHFETVMRPFGLPKGR